MRIEDHRVSAKFGDIKAGECFEYEGDIFMKAIGYTVGNVPDAVDLRHGALTKINNDETVWRVDAKVVID